MSVTPARAALNALPTATWLPSAIALNAPGRQSTPQIFRLDGDLFAHPEPSFVLAVFQSMARARQHTFTFQTSHPATMFELIERWCADRMSPFEDATVPPNIWPGVLVNDQAGAHAAIPQLCKTPAAGRYVAMPTLIGPVNLRPLLAQEGLGRPDIVCVGGMASGMIHPHWVRLIRDECQRANVHFCFAGWGSWIPVCQLPEGTPFPTTADKALLRPDGSVVEVASANEATAVIMVRNTVPNAMLDGADYTRFFPDK